MYQSSFYCEIQLANSSNVLPMLFWFFVDAVSDHHAAGFLPTIVIDASDF